MNLLISFGPLKVFIDEVRFISNSSSGIFGYKLLEEGLKRRYKAKAILGKTGLKRPQGVKGWTEVSQYQEMLEALVKNFPWADILIMAAAVPDFMPHKKEAGKIPRKSGSLSLKLKATKSILGELAKKKGREDKILVGFSLETENALKKAQQTLKAHNLDLVVALSLKESNMPFGDARVSASLVFADKIKRLPLLKKGRAAEYIFDAIEEIKTAKKYFLQSKVLPEDKNSEIIVNVL